MLGSLSCTVAAAPRGPGSRTHQLACRASPVPWPWPRICPYDFTPSRLTVPGDALPPAAPAGQAQERHKQPISRVRPNSSHASWNTMFYSQICQNIQGSSRETAGRTWLLSNRLLDRAHALGEILRPSQVSGI